jgi:enoyl-[acyl-carrier-protein] reductase (NADH)
MLKTYEQRSPLKRNLVPEELARPASSWPGGAACITGQVISMDGGTRSWM